MIDWNLSFQAPLSLAPDTIAGALAKFCGAPVTTSIGELDGNPRDYYWRSVAITGRRGDVVVTVSLSQHFMSTTDPDPDTEIHNVGFTTPQVSFPQMREVWNGLRDALGAIGCTDLTLVRPAAARIVARMENAGETALAAALRAEITAALVAEARTEVPFIYLTSSRADLDAVLAACPPTTTRVFFEDCRFKTLPRALERFTDLTYLQITEEDIDGDLLRGWSFPRLAWLSLRGSSVRRLAREDVAGFPDLDNLDCYRSKLRWLDPEIIGVCPSLTRVGIADTPLARDAETVKALKARWPKVTWDV
jgi:hypothetical protein